MNAVIARLALRYISGMLLARGFINADIDMTLANDPELIGLVEMGIGVLAGLAAEYWYRLAKRLGWQT